MDSVPNSGPFIVVANHNSHLDTGLLLVVLANRSRCLHPLAAKDYWFRNRIASWISHTFIDAVPFDRNAHFAQSLGLGVALLRENHSLLFFPEGGRSTTGEMRTFKAGIGVLALESKAQIVPARISGSYEALSKGMWFPARHKIRVRFGAPIPIQPYLQSHGDGDNPELARKITDDVQKAVEALR
jgi:1-acyl-sn-glycerol-3-phosphate acyltransferase